MASLALTWHHSPFTEDDFQRETVNDGQKMSYPQAGPPGGRPSGGTGERAKAPTDAPAAGTCGRLWDGPEPAGAPGWEGAATSIVGQGAGSGGTITVSTGGIARRQHHESGCSGKSGPAPVAPL